MKSITFVTGNNLKWATAQRGLAQFPIQLERAKLDTPEIQADHSEAVARFSAEHAFAQLNRPLFVTDVNYDIPALGGFPGPFMKQMNGMLTAHQLLDLMQNVTDRRILITEYLAYAAPGEPVRVFSSQIVGHITTEVKGPESANPINRILVMDGMPHTLAESPEAESLTYWDKALTHYTALGEWVSQQA
jgi:non-canonical purine NTP pyrophosphatase (RdgB/HAM1 family)